MNPYEIHQNASARGVTRYGAAYLRRSIKYAKQPKCAVENPRRSRPESEPAREARAEYLRRDDAAANQRAVAETGGGTECRADHRAIQSRRRHRGHVPTTRSEE